MTLAGNASSSPARTGCPSREPPPDQLQRLLQQRAILRLVRPGAPSGRMREHDQLERMSAARHAVNAAHDLFQLGDAEELLRGERADGDDDLRSEERRVGKGCRAEGGG